jgi:hypothetical protein
MVSTETPQFTRNHLADMIDWLMRQNITIKVVEHGIEQDLLLHSVDIYTPPQFYGPHLVVHHPVACGCDVLPDEVVLHG